jgi:bifunctional UDP-N-acetylglucosamine pyrophosphorylase/glucosamine-1-phosphate N-acetyltransferase
MRPEAGRPAAMASLQADQAAGEQRSHQPEADLEILLRHAPSLGENARIGAEMALEIIILAAGQGKRMRSSRPKILHPLAGRPLLGHVLAAAHALSARKTVVVHGHGAEEVRAAFDGSQVEWVLQAQQLGTGHAVRQAMPQISIDAEVLILYGDVPLVRVDTLRRLSSAGREGVGVLTADVQDPAGYGRIVRDPAGQVKRIVEQKDASPEELRLREINAGFMAMSAKRLSAWLDRLTDRNAQNEYYLTDVVTLAVAEGVPVSAVKAEAWEVAGVNSRRELAQLERQYQRMQAERLLEAGVTLADPARIDVRGELVCGQDVAIDVNCVFEGGVSLGDGVRIGPNCVLRNVSVASGTERSPIWRIRKSARVAGLALSRACGPAPALPRACISAISSRSRRAASAADPRPTTSATSGIPRSAPTSTSAPARSPATTTAPRSTAR